MPHVFRRVRQVVGSVTPCLRRPGPLALLAVAWLLGLAGGAAAQVSRPIPMPLFDGDAKADPAVYRAAYGTWFWLESTENNTAYTYVGWGDQAQGDRPVLGDFDGDGRVDPTVYRPASGTWFTLEASSNFTEWTYVGWGATDDIPVPADYDHDGKADPAVYRPSTGTWYIRGSGLLGQVAIPFGTETDLPIPIDVEGDGHADCAVYRPGTGFWYVRPSSGSAPAGWSAQGGGVFARAYGGVGGVTPVPADYDGDGRTDLAVYRAATGQWAIDQSSVLVNATDRSIVIGWGAAGDQPVPADYDDDQTARYTGRVDVAVYRPSTGTWYVRPWGAQPWSFVFGASGDRPLNRAPWPTTTVAVTSPIPGTVFPGSSAITLSADVAVTHGEVVRVEFRVDGQTVGTVTTAPYSLSWSGGAVGDHQVVAVVVDSAGVRTRSAPVSFSISNDSTKQLGPPVITPAGGAFHDSLVVTIRAAVGAHVHYTTDTTDPTEGSTVYAGPLTVTQSLVLKAKAFQDTWTASGVSTAAFTLDTVAPSISASVEPAVNAQGWHHTAPTVYFTCTDAGSGVATCPGPVMLTTPGANQVVTGTAVDRAGNTASAQVTLSLDQTPPAVTVTSPSAEAVVSGATVAVTATVSDVGTVASGVVGATCNGGAPESLEGGVVACTVPVAVGVNDLVVQAVDAAGNTASAGVRIRVTGEPTSLTVAPASVALVVGARRAFTAVDQHGVPVADAAWTVSDASVAELDPVAPGTIRALAVGAVTVTATRAPLTSSTTVTVYAGPTLPMGTVQWAVPPVDATASQGLVFTHRTEPEVPDVFVQEGGWATPALFRPVTDGVPGTPVVPPLASGEVVEATIGETFGGLLLRVTDYALWSSALVRTAGPASTIPWRFTAVGSLGPVAQGPDGTIYVVETSANGTVRDLLGVSGATGQVAFRLRVPGAITDTTYNTDCEVGVNSVSRHAPAVSDPIIGADGNAYVQVHTSAGTWDYLPCTIGSGSQSGTLSVLRVSPTGSVSEVTLHEYDRQLPATTLMTVSTGHLAAAEGGVVATWGTSETSGEVTTSAAWATVLGAGAPTTYELTAERAGPALVGADNRAFTVSATGVVAYDVTSGAVAWTAPVTGEPVLATEGGGVVVRADDGTLMPLDGEGQADAGALLPLEAPVYWGAGTWYGEIAGLAVAMEGPTSIEGAFWFDVRPQGGNKQRQSAQADPPRITVGVHLLVPSPPAYEYSVAERTLIWETARATAQAAFQGYNVDFTVDERTREEIGADPRQQRHVYVNNMIGPTEGEVGATYGAVRYSDVYFWSLEKALRVAEGCWPSGIDDCAQQKGTTRVALVTALGRGLGATVAHELGHQFLLDFTKDVTDRSDCYDSLSAVSHDHFFNPLDWSDQAKERMKVVLRRLR